MVVVECPVPDCVFRTDDVSEALAVALLTIHGLAHQRAPSAAAAPSPSPAAQGPKLDRPRVDVGVSIEEWNVFLRRWEVFHAPFQLFQCAGPGLGDSLLKANATIASGSLQDLITAMRSLAVIPVATCVLRTDLLQLSQERDETFRAFAARVRGHNKSSMPGPSSASATKTRTRKMKRKASPERVPLRKLSEGEHANTSEEEVSVSGAESKISAANGKGPARNKRPMKPRKTKDETHQDTKQETSQEPATNLIEEFEAKYQQEHHLGKGGCGSVFAGYRKADHLHVAIKHIPRETVFCREVGKNGKLVPSEVAIMLKLANRTSDSAGSSAPVSLLDWYDLGHKLILVMERPTPSMDLFHYIQLSGDCLLEDEAKVIMKQLVDAASELQKNNVFHRDIKVENILIETGTDEPRVRLIDFGLGCFTKKRSR